MCCLSVEGFAVGLWSCDCENDGGGSDDEVEAPGERENKAFTLYIFRRS
jgi:hypothetical protein